MNCANHPDRERIAFCQNCGKPLCQECTRTVGSAVFCEPCLAARLAAADASASATQTPNATPYGYADPTATAGIPVPPPQPGDPSPILATILGVFPGVGAMYNGQYAKGVVHLIVFAVLVSLANQNGIFGLFVAGWIVYQIIEANHTARARLTGAPLPNPFGLNDLGERLGFGKAWPAAPAYSPSGSTPPAQAAAYRPAEAAPTAGHDAAAQSFSPNGGAYYAQSPESSQPYAAPPANSWPPQPNPYAYPTYPAPTPPTAPRFPMGAIWLIALGIIFLVGNSGLFNGFPVQRFIPFILIGLGVWVFVHKMSDSGMGLTDDGTAMYRWRLFRALRGSIWITLVGVLFLLDTFDILSWGRSWPLFIIVGGLMTFLERTTIRPAAPAYPYPGAPGPYPPPAAQANPAATPTPSTTHDNTGNNQEGS